MRGLPSGPWAFLTWSALSVFLASSAGGASAQLLPETEPLYGEPIIEVVVTGESAGVTAPEEVGVPLGSQLTRQLLRQTVLELMGSGRWDDVQLRAEPAPAGVRLVARLSPRVLLVRVDIVGNTVLEDDELRRAIGLTEGSELRTERREELKLEVQTLYEQRGYEQASVELLVRDTDDPARKVLIVRVVEGAPTPVGRIVFEGEDPPPESQARDALDFDSGDPLDRRHIERGVRQAEETMRSRGFLRARLRDPIYRPSPRGVDVVIPARVGPRYRLEIRGYGPISRTEIEETIRLGEDRLTRNVEQTLAERAVDLFKRYGYHDATATVSTEVGEEGDAALVLTIERGSVLQVAAVTFPGARHFETDFLRNQVYSYLQEDLPGSSLLYPVDTETVDSLGFGGSRTPRREVPRPLVADPETVFYEPSYEEAALNIEELYKAEGFLDATCGPARLDVFEDGRAIVHMPVEEGPQTRLHEVSFEGNTVLTPGELSADLALVRGDPFSYLALEDARSTLEDRYQELGHYYVRVEPSVQFSEDRTRARVIFEIVESFEVEIGDIRIEGNELTEESLIRERLAFGSGDLLRPSQFLASQESLATLGIFSGVNIAPEDADLPARVKPVVVTVTERKPQYIELRVGFSTGEGFRGHIEYGYRNIFGLGHEFVFSLDLAFQVLFLGDPQLRQRFESLSNLDRLERTLSLQWRIPHFFDRFLNLSVNGVINRNNERDFGLERLAAETRLGWTPSGWLNVDLGASIERTSVDLFVSESLGDFLRNNTDPRLERLLRVPEGSTTIAATEAGISLDFRDSPFRPSEGVFANVTAEYVASLTSEEQDDVDPFSSNFIKLSLATSGYVPVTEDVVFAAQLRLGRIFHLAQDSKTYPNRAFFLGGVDTVRGYLQDALIPQDVADQVVVDADLGPNDVARAGDAFFLLRGELRFPIVGVFRGGVFLDLGNLWADPSLVFETFSLRPTAGLGLRIETPVGPLAFDYGVILVRRPQLREPFGTFHFSIGLF